MIRWYFDFISPYAYLQSTRLSQLQHYGDIECVPVLFAGLLEHWDNVGPAEVAPKRDWTFKRITYLCHRDGVALNLPASHPFNPLPLLRLSIALNNDLIAVQRIFRYVWAEGHLPEDDAFTDLLNEFDIHPDQLRSPEVKQTLHNNGRHAAAAGIFGVPTLTVDDELFWGDDATDMAIDFCNDTHWPSEAFDAAKNLATGKNRITRLPDSHHHQSNNHKPDNHSPRLPLLPVDFNEPESLVAAIRQRRGGELIELDRLLLHSVPLAEGWNAFIGNVRNKFSVSQQLRELAICTIAVVNGASYEYKQHAPLYINNGGDQRRAEAVKDIANIERHIDLFDQQEKLTLALAEQMTRHIRIDDSLFHDCEAAFTRTELVELIATIAAYNMVSRFLVALELH